MEQEEGFYSFLKNDLGLASGERVSGAQALQYRKMYQDKLQKRSEEEAKSKSQQAAAAIVAASFRGKDSEETVNQAAQYVQATGDITGAVNLFNAKAQTDKVLSEKQLAQEKAKLDQEAAAALNTERQAKLLEINDKRQADSILRQQTIQELKARKESIERLRKEDISDVVGYTEGMAKPGRNVLAGMGVEWAQQNQDLLKRLRMLTADKVLEKAKAVAPVTKTDIEFIEQGYIPQETDNEKTWDDYLKKEAGNVDKTLQSFETRQKQSAAEGAAVLGGIATPAPQSAAPADATSRLGALREKLRPK